MASRITPPQRTATAQAADPAFTNAFAPKATSYRKSSDQALNVSDTTVQNITGLAATLAANTTYYFDGDIYYDSTTTGDFKLGFDIPADATIEWSVVGPATTAAAPGTITSGNHAVITTDAGTTPLGGAGTGNKVSAKVRGRVVAVTAGTMQAIAAQNVSDPVAANVFAGSVLHLRPA